MKNNATKNFDILTTSLSVT